MLRKPSLEIFLYKIENFGNKFEVGHVQEHQDHIEALYCTKLKAMALPFERDLYLNAFFHRLPRK